MAGNRKLHIAWLLHYPQLWQRLLQHDYCSDKQLVGPWKFACFSACLTFGNFPEVTRKITPRVRSPPVLFGKIKLIARLTLRHKDDFHEFCSLIIQLVQLFFSRAGENNDSVKPELFLNWVIIIRLRMYYNCKSKLEKDYIHYFKSDYKKRDIKVRDSAGWPSSGINRCWAPRQKKGANL